MQKSEQVFTLLIHKNQLPFFLCAKYGPKVEPISEHDKRSVLSTDDRELLNQNLSKNRSLNLFIVQTTH